MVYVVLFIYLFISLLFFFFFVVILDLLELCLTLPMTLLLHSPLRREKEPNKLKPSTRRLGQKVLFSFFPFSLFFLPFSFFSFLFSEKRVHELDETPVVTERVRLLLENNIGRALSQVGKVVAEMSDSLQVIITILLFFLFAIIIIIICNYYFF